MKNFIFTFSILVTLLFSIGVPVFAAQDPLSAQIWTTAGGNTSVNDTTLSQMIGKGIKIVLGFVGTIFFALTVFAGFTWMTAQGNAEKVEQAQGILRTAVIGLIIVLAAYSITTFALIFTGSATTPPNTTVGG